MARGRADWKTISKSIKSQHSAPPAFARATERQFQRASNHNTNNFDITRRTLKDNFKEHQITTKGLILPAPLELKDNFKEHQITTCRPLSCYSRYWKTISKSIKSQLSRPNVVTRRTERQFQRASNHNDNRVDVAITKLKDNFKEHQITTATPSTCSGGHWKTISKSIKSQPLLIL